MAASDSAAITRFRTSLVSALASSDKSAFDNATRTLAVATRTPISDVFSLPQLQADQQLSDLLSLAADLRWLEFSRSWASITKQTRPNRQSSDQSNSTSTSIFNTPSNNPSFIATPTVSSTHMPTSPPLHAIHSLTQSKSVSTLSTAANTTSVFASPNTTIAAATSKAVTSNRTLTSSNKTLARSPTTRIHWFHPNATTQQAFIPPLPSQPVPVPIAVTPTVGGFRPSFRSWKWFGSGAGRVEAFGPTYDSNKAIGEDEDILSTMRLTKDTKAAGITVAAAFRAMVPFLEDGQRRTLRNSIAYADPLQALDLIVNAVYSVCGRSRGNGASNAGVGGADGPSTITTVTGTGTSNGSEMQKAWNGGTTDSGLSASLIQTSNALGSSQLGRSVNGFGFDVWTDNGREVAWSPLQRPSTSTSLDPSSLDVSTVPFISHKH